MIKNRLSPEQLAQRARLSALATRTQLVALPLLFALWTLVLNPPEGANPWVIWLFQSVPLLAFVPSVFKGQSRPHIWLCFVVLIYFCGGVMYAAGGSVLGWLQTLLCAGLFSSAMLYARWNSLLNNNQVPPL